MHPVERRVLEVVAAKPLQNRPWTIASIRERIGELTEQRVRNEVAMLIHRKYIVNSGLLGYVTTPQGDAELQKGATSESDDQSG